LVDQQDEYTARFGFAFLNSQDCATLTRAIEAAELAAVQAIGNDAITETFRLWREANQYREVGMMNNIEAYCASNTLDRGVFLVGSAHRQSVFDMSQQRSVEGSPAVHWDFPGLGDST
jgi:hypothetical protein